MLRYFVFIVSFYQGVKNEAEAYMLKELSMLKWQEKATKLASENNATEVVELQGTVSSLEENVKIERLVLFDYILLFDWQ